MHDRFAFLATETASLHGPACMEPELYRTAINMITPVNHAERALSMAASLYIIIIDNVITLYGHYEKIFFGM